jgi:hypothetical protein
MKKWRLRSGEPKLTAVGIRCADDAIILYQQKLAPTSLTSGSRVRLRTKSHGVVFKLILIKIHIHRV